ncbi:hypothetical protein GQ457_01G022040 [Hibiscus cannabinus]
MDTCAKGRQYSCLRQIESFRQLISEFETEQSTIIDQYLGNLGTRKKSFILSRIRGYNGFIICESNAPIIWAMLQF